MYDMVITITGLDMARRKRGRMSRSTAGYAYVGGACVRNSRLSKISSVALVEDSGAYSGVVVTAHELGGWGPESLNEMLTPQACWISRWSRLGVVCPLGR